MSLTLFAGLATACSPMKFSSHSNSPGGYNNTDGGPSPNDEVPGTLIQTCTEQLQQLTVPVKLLFVVDTSGSNLSNAGGAGTDPNKVVRGQSIQEFFNNYKAKSNFNWGFTIFSGTTSSALIGSSSTQPTFTNVSNVMQSAIDYFHTVNDAQETPYLAAMNLAKTALTNDHNRTDQTKWVVVFMSDGMPNPDVDQTTLNANVAQIVNTIPGQVTFNTVYYGPADPAAVSRLQSMAYTGYGKFLNTNNSGRSFPIEDVITIPGMVCH